MEADITAVYYYGMCVDRSRKILRYVQLAAAASRYPTIA